MTPSSNARTDKIIEGLYRTVLPLAIMGLASMDFVSSLMDPSVTAAQNADADVQGLHGTTQAVTVQLANPSILDRIVASCPSLMSLLMVVIAYSYLMWERRSHGYDKRRAMRLGIALGVAGLFILVSPTITGATIGLYFDVKIPVQEMGVSALMVTGAFATLLVGAFGNRVAWMREHQRAEKLDAELENVV
jgi:hypothetical protein